MKNWLKYFFGSFFSHKLTKEGTNRSSMNSFLSVILSLVILSLSLAFGRNVAIISAYGKADNLKNFMDYAFSSDSVDFTVDDGVLANESVINSYEHSEHENFRRYGYNLVIDTRNVSKLYDDFELICISTVDGVPDISYSEFLKLGEVEQSKYTSFDIKYSGIAIDTKANYDKYMAEIRLFTEEGSSKYNETVANSLKVLEENRPEDYYDQIYLIYTGVYYPSMEGVESDTYAPTLHGYYQNLMNKDTDGKFAVILNNVCYISFEQNEKTYLYVGSYVDLSNEDLTSEAFLTKTLNYSNSVNYIVYLFQVFNATTLVACLFTWLVLALILSALFRKQGIKIANRLLSALALIASFSLYAGVFAAVIAFVGSFFMPQVAVFYCAIISFIIIIVARTLVFAVTEVNYHKNNPDEEEEEVFTPIRSLHEIDAEDDVAVETNTDEEISE